MEKEISNTQIEENNQTLSSLQAIAVQYENCDSDVESISSSSDNVEEVEVETNRQEQEETGTEKERLNNEEIEVVTICDKTNYRTNTQDSSSSDESDSEDSSDTDSSSNSEDTEDSDNSDERSIRNTNKNRTVNQASRDKEPKNELDNLPPIEDLKINVPEVLCDPFGEVAWIVEQLVVVRPKEGKPTLNLDTILFVDRGRRALGKIFDVFGQVSEPHYCVRFNSPKHIEESKVKIGMTVYYCPNTPYTSLVFLHELVKMKGSDAVDEDEPPEFSDDEEERKYYESLRQKNNQNKANEDIPSKRKRTSANSSGWQSNHPWNKNANPRMQKNENYHFRNSSKHYPDNAWPPYGYHNNPYWPAMQRPMYPGYMHNGYPAYPSELHNIDQESSSSGHRQQHGPQLLHNPRIPFGSSPRFPPGVPLNHRPMFPSPNARFPYTNVSWQSQMPFPIGTPWIAPPPPPPPSQNNK